MPFSELAAAQPVLFLSLAGLFGLMFGSFFNVVIYRLPKMMEQRWDQECRQMLELPAKAQEKLSLATPGSHCPHCQAPVRAWQNIPVLSYVMLRGRCGHCKAGISPRYPAIELATAALTVFALAHFGFTAQGAAVVLLSWLLLILSMIDIDHQLLPDQLTLPLLWLGLAYHAVSGQIPLQDAVWGAIFGYLILWAVYWLFKLITGKEGMGYGDFKLLAALGAWLGWQPLPLVIILSSLVGAVLGGLMMIISRRSGAAPIPFGPYLAAAGWIAMFWGDELITSYLQFAGLQ